MTILGQRPAHYLPPFGMVCVATVFLLMTYQLPVAARAMPVLVGWIGLTLALLDIASRTGSELGRTLMRSLNPAGLQTATERGETPAAAELGPLVTGVGLVVLLVTTFVLAGVLVAAPVMIFTALMIADRGRILANLLLAAVVTGAIWLLFSMVLRLQLYAGVLFGGSF